MADVGNLRKKGSSLESVDCASFVKIARHDPDGMLQAVEKSIFNMIDGYETVLIIIGNYEPDMRYFGFVS